MLDNLTLWYELVARYVTPMAYMFGGNVLVASAPNSESTVIPMFDPTVVLGFMNTNPHLLQETYYAWEQSDDETVSELFCRALYDQMIAGDKFEAQLNSLQLADPFFLNAAIDELSNKILAFIGGHQYNVVFADTDGPTMAAKDESFSLAENQQDFPAQRGRLIDFDLDDSKILYPSATTYTGSLVGTCDCGSDHKEDYAQESKSMVQDTSNPIIQKSELAIEMDSTSIASLGHSSLFNLHKG